MNPQLHYSRIRGAELAHFEWNFDSVNKITVLFIHGAGCHARCWDGTIRAIERSPSLVSRLIAVELRGHGRSSQKGPYTWDQFGADTVALIEELDLQSVLLVGHSMGGHVALQTVGRLQERVSGLLLVEPAVYPPRSYRLSRTMQFFDSPSEHPVAQRRSTWTSPNEWFDVLRDRKPYTLWNQDILWDHCQYGVVPTDSGQYELCCPPLIEAESYLEGLSTDVHGILGSIRVPTRILRAKTAPGMRHPMDTVHSVTWPLLAERIPNADDFYYPELSHCIPMQRPELVADAITALSAG